MVKSLVPKVLLRVSWLDFVCAFSKLVYRGMGFPESGPYSTVVELIN